MEMLCLASLMRHQLDTVHIHELQMSLSYQQMPQTAAVGVACPQHLLCSDSSCYKQRQVVHSCRRSSAGAQVSLWKYHCQLLLPLFKLAVSQQCVAFGKFTFNTFALAPAQSAITINLLALLLFLAQYHLINRKKEKNIMFLF